MPSLQWSIPTRVALHNIASAFVTVAQYPNNRGRLSSSSSLSPVLYIYSLKVYSPGSSILVPMNKTTQQVNKEFSSDFNSRRWSLTRTYVHSSLRPSPSMPKHIVDYGETFEEVRQNLKQEFPGKYFTTQNMPGLRGDSQSWLCSWLKNEMWVNIDWIDSYRPALGSKAGRLCFHRHLSLGPQLGSRGGGIWPPFGQTDLPPTPSQTFPGQTPPFGQTCHPPTPTPSQTHTPGQTHHPLPHTQRYGQAPIGRHPTRMHSCSTDFLFCPGHSLVFIKEGTSMLGDRVEDSSYIPEDYIHTFLIRHPAKTLNSFVSMVTDGANQSVGGKSLYSLVR